MDTLDAFLHLHHAAGNATWLREALTRIDAGTLFAAPVAEWLALGATIGAREAAHDRAAAEYATSVRAWLARDPRHAVLGWADLDYPSLLREVPNPPTVLFIDGQTERLWWPQIAVVGSRAPTPAGRERAARWARAFADAGFVVTSGLAAGIDAAAHAAALDVATVGPGTIAVTGTGPDRCFPAAHRSLHRAIAASGCVVTEHAPGTEARPQHFPSRNRIIAGLSLATVVVEAAQRSGALITARLAAESGREVFALPGTPENLKARGCHRLIRDGAVLVDDPAQVIEAVAEGVGDVAKRLRRAIVIGSSGGDKACPSTSAGGDGDTLLQALGAEGAGFDELLARSGLTPAVLAPILIAMELDGRLTQQHGVYLPCGFAPPTRAGLQRRR